MKIRYIVITPDFDWSRTLKEIAKELKCTIAKANKLKKASGVTPNPQGWRGRSYEGIDWNKSNRAIAKEQGVAYQRISQIRRQRIQDSQNKF